MANKKAKPKPTLGQRVARWVMLALLALALLLAGYMSLCANLLRVRRAVVNIPDLPAAFDGKTILYAADFDICGLNTPAKLGDLFQSLQALKPDLLILGGDYTADTVFDRLNNTIDESANTQRKVIDTSALLRALSDFEAPLGRYAIATADDGDLDALADIMRANGFTPVFNACVAIKSEGAIIALLGMCDENTRVDIPSYHIGTSDCLIAVVASPECFPKLMTNEPRSGGVYADMALAGHTHGGQIVVNGRTLFQLGFHENNHLYGWRREGGIPLLTTSGIGCEWINWRLGTAPEVWLITLTQG